MQTTTELQGFAVVRPTKSRKKQSMTTVPSVTYWGLELRDWVTIAATLLGPILAVQAQKAVENFRQARERKVQIFSTLMATRAARVSSEHVRALNMIDIVFYGRRVFGLRFQTKPERVVTETWREYFTHLDTKVVPEAQQAANLQSDALFANLLYEMAKALDFAFDKALLKRGAYYPIAHSELDRQADEVRRGIVAVLSGEAALNMNIVGLPPMPDRK
jgi:hypothetical protein